MPAGCSVCLSHDSVLSFHKSHDAPLILSHLIIRSSRDMQCRNDISKWDDGRLSDHLWSRHISWLLEETTQKSMFFYVSFSYLFADRPRHRHGERPDVAAAQVLPFPLVTEELQFSLLLVIQTVTVAYLETHKRTHQHTLVKCDLLLRHREIKVVSCSIIKLI